jgi:ElaA protein
MNALEWKWLEINSMGSEQLYALLALRISIFVVEQQCPYQEADGLDHAAAHLIGQQEGKIMACLRLLPPDHDDTQGLQAAHRDRLGKSSVASGTRGVERSVHAVERSRLLPKTGAGKRNSFVCIGRVAVEATSRGSGLARQMMVMALDRAATLFPGHPVFVSAQTYLHDFYQSLGFVVSGDDYLEDGIPHLPMTLERR